MICNNTPAPHIPEVFFDTVCHTSIKNLNLSAEENLIEASHNFYNYLNILDITECSGIAVAPIPDHDLGKTINDRLRRASHKDEQ